MRRRLGLPAATVSYDEAAPTLAELESRLSRDLERGTTGLGPHLHDIELTVGERELRSFASQGEQRVAVLSLVLAEAEAIAVEVGCPAARSARRRPLGARRGPPPRARGARPRPGPDDRDGDLTGRAPGRPGAVARRILGERTDGVEGHGADRTRRSRTPWRRAAAAQWLALGGDHRGLAGGGRRSGRRGRRGRCDWRATERCTWRRRRRPGRSSSTGSLPRYRSGWPQRSGPSAPAKLRFRVGPIPEHGRTSDEPAAASAEPFRTTPETASAGRGGRGRDRGSGAARNRSQERHARASRGPAPTAISDRLPAARKTSICRAFSIGRSSLHRKGHHGPGRPRAGPASTRHVHRVDGIARPSSPRLRGRRQRRRRGARRPQRARRRHDPPGQLGHRRGRRRGHSGRRHRRSGAARADRRADEAARRRQVRRRRLQGLRRAARRRRLGRERALGVARRRGPARREGLPAGVRARRADDRHGDDRRRSEGRVGDDDLVPPRPRGLRRDRVRRRDALAATPRDGVPHARPQDRPPRRARRRQDRGVPLRGRDPRLRRARQRVQGHRPQAHRLLRGRERRGPGRGRDAVEQLVRRVGVLVREQHQHDRGRRAPLGLPLGADPDAQQLRAQRRAC